MANSILFIGITIILYLLAKKLYSHYSFPLLVPITTSTFVIILFLSNFHVSYHSYMNGGKWIHMMLGPAVVSFAYPLFEHKERLKTHFLSIIISVFTGTIIGFISGVCLSIWLGLKQSVILSLAAKSVTTPVAMSITSIIGGIPSLTVVYVMIAGISGAIFGPYILTLLKIDHPVAIGVGYGLASHGIGTVKAAEYGEVEQAISSITMTLSAIFASLICPIFIRFFIK